MWKLNIFSASLILREINFGWFQKVKNYHFWRLWISIWRQISRLQMSKIAKNWKNLELLKWSKWHFLTFWNQPKLISLKIRMAGKWLNCHSVEYPPKFPIRLPRSVEPFYRHDNVWNPVRTFMSSPSSEKRQPSWVTKEASIWYFPLFFPEMAREPTSCLISCRVICS